MIPKYCKNCGIRIRESSWFQGETTFVEFEDGVYCIDCAKIKLDKARKK